uniref:Chlorophyll a-b binding protein, chloroplastic n=1 Tax=Salix viminalis TaxID=40686 RepID=A0A6N2MXH4_SALVM
MRDLFQQGADRQLWFASKQSLSYLDGSLPGDFGFDPLGLSDPEGTGGFIEPKWLAYGEIINGRYAMLGAVGAIDRRFWKGWPHTSRDRHPWSRPAIPPAGTTATGRSIHAFCFEMALMDSQSTGDSRTAIQAPWASSISWIEKENPAYPGGPLFNPLGFGKDEKSLKELKLKEVKNGRLAMLAILGYFVQGLVTGVGPYQNLLDHLADPVNNNVLTSLKFH